LKVNILKAVSTSGYIMGKSTNCELVMIWKEAFIAKWSNIPVSDWRLSKKKILGQGRLPPSGAIKMEFMENRSE
jgi:hypothetical protein